MINTLIFDFGNVFIDLDIKNGLQESLKAFGISALSEDIIKINEHYEIGTISTDDFIEFYAKKFPHLTKSKLINLWNNILKDFPTYRLDFIKNLKTKNKFKLILLSNTNELHIEWIKKNIAFYEEFKACFNAFYLSHEIHLRKPSIDIFEFVLDTNNLKAENCIFIDDNSNNIETAIKAGMKAWNINPEKDDIIDLFYNKKDLF
ncbi:HAD family phosphatase [Tamlana fucoidanivorans]|uniref:HAD family phosphatase n=1 Tax=Allotamlana fucoidanivorans TaxID=2583814 RepID=A0A5C4SHM1_9FLAO|nr:HAD family phosphatase [Tamlana fucoidanivorans]TNJ43111.1 HAD family phosphatase [Tamlana fucoidanivorans]